MINVALVEPQALLREALKVLLNADSGFTVAADAASAAEILPILQRSPLDLVLLSLEPGGEDPDGALSGLLTGSRQRRALILTGDTDPEFHFHMIELGAMGVVLKGQTGEILGKAIRKVHGGELWLDRSKVGVVVNGLSRGRWREADDEVTKVESLTAREREIVALVAEGLNNTRIAERLFISSFTVRNHLTSILGKLDLTDRFQLAVYAFRRGLVLCPLTAARLRMATTMKRGLVRRSEHHFEPRLKEG